jgi:hypothetical protein
MMRPGMSAFVVIETNRESIGILRPLGKENRWLISSVSSPSRSPGCGVGVKKSKP